MKHVAFAAVQDGRPGWLVGHHPREVVEARRLAEVLPALATMQAAAGQGRWAAGFVTYEAAAGLDGCLAVGAPGRLPLLQFGLFDELEFAPELAHADGAADLAPWQMGTSHEEYHAAIARIKDLIAAGDTYQVNYTVRLDSRLSGEPLALFGRLAAAQESPYAAFIDGDEFAICSASPELFFQLDGQRILSRPMKGTAARGLWVEQDRQMRQRLAGSAKDRAENLMILDMVRNDIGRIAELGSVRVPGLFQIEQYPTVFQMTSTAEGRTAASLPELFAALFPCASITGAPKVRTMQIIRELEPRPRGVYCGAIGYIGPGRTARFSVAIRTAVVDKSTGAVEYGVGGGIVWDSLADSEYQECLTKAALLGHRMPPFELLETLRFEPSTGYFLLDGHLRRLAESASYFGWSVNLADVTASLDKLAAGLSGRSRIRLRVDRSGRCTTEASPLPPADPVRPWRLRLARSPIATDDVFLYHKTTHRQMYDRAAADRGDADDVLLWNDRGQVTETLIANIIAELDGRLVTPPVSCGLLGGVMRAHLLASGQVAERPIALADLARCTRLFIINSVRGRLPAVVEGAH